MNSELKPCPFCGGEAELIRIAEDMFYCMCSNDECPSYCSYEDEKEAINAWNQRAERTCKVVRRDRDEYGEFAEYSCGHANVWQSWSEPKFCCWCGAKVVE